MALEHDYQRIASRSLSACDAAIAGGIHEKAAFLAYHAFESTGCALSAHVGLKVGPQVHHSQKVANFKSAAQFLHNELPVASLAVTLNGLRNGFLYPRENRATGSFDLPENVISPADTVKLKKRVAGIVKWVGGVL